ncbi:hypothetical protein L1279_003614 [Planomicrobium sp. HSC-17F08]|nr:hypothetical protein [Planomicrobium sp. HSC-17F08]
MKQPQAKAAVFYILKIKRFFSNTCRKLHKGIYIHPSKANNTKDKENKKKMQSTDLYEEGSQIFSVIEMTLR